MKASCYLIILLSFFSCSKKNIKKVSTTEPKTESKIDIKNIQELPIFITKITPKDTQISNLVEILRFQKTACFGFCPTFDFILYSNGLILYNGKMHVKHEGLIYGLMSESQWTTIKSKAASINFNNLAERYPTNEREEIPDLPLTITGVNYNGVYKIVKNSHSAPLELKELEAHVQSIVEEFLTTQSKKD